MTLVCEWRVSAICLNRSRQAQPAGFLLEKRDRKCLSCLDRRHLSFPKEDNILSLATHKDMERKASLSARSKIRTRSLCSRRGFAPNPCHHDDSTQHYFMKSQYGDFCQRGCTEVSGVGFLAIAMTFIHYNFHTPTKYDIII